MDELVADCLVQLRTRDGFGTGFFVAEWTVLTCAHVVHGCAQVKGFWRGERVTGRVLDTFPEHRGDGQYYGLPDIAVIAIDPLGPHPSVWLSDPAQRLAEGQVVTAHGFSAHGPGAPGVVRDVRRLTVGGHLDLGCVRVKDDSLPEGMSGGLVIDGRTGRVGGFVKASEDYGGVHPSGGWIVSVTALHEHVPWLVEANRRACSVWREAVDQADTDRSHLAEMLQRDAPPDTDPQDWAPSHYLDPRWGIATFLPRPELETLRKWCGRDTPVIVRAVYGPGGAGKTRLAIQLIDAVSQDSEWIAGRLEYRTDVDVDRLAAAVAGRKVLLCIDNAEDWASALRMLLKKITGIEHRHVRILLLARTIGRWWHDLRSVGRVKDLIGPEPIRLRQLGEEIDRAELLRSAYQDFRGTIWPAAPADPPQVLLEAAPRERGVLGLHAAALAVVLHIREHGGLLPTVMPDLRDPLHDILIHERNRWHGWFRSGDVAVPCGGFQGDERDLSGRVLLVATLYRAADEAQAVTALAGVLDQGGYPADLAGKVAATLHKVYPNTQPEEVRYWDPLQPDRLGETLILEVLDEAASTERCVELVCSIFAEGIDEAQAEHALIALTRASRLATPFEGETSGPDELARQRAVDCVGAALRRFPDTFLPAATTVTTGLAEPGRMIDIIEAALQEAPGEVARAAVRPIAPLTGTLARLEAVLWERSIAHASVRPRSGTRTVSQEQDLGNQYRYLGDAWEQAGEFGKALDAARESVERYQKTVVLGRNSARLDMAEVQTSVADRAAAGSPDEAIDQISEAVDTFRDLLGNGTDCRGSLIYARFLRERLLRENGRTEDADRELVEIHRDKQEEERAWQEAWPDEKVLTPQVEHNGRGDVELDPGGKELTGNEPPPEFSALDRYTGPRASFDDPKLQVVFPIGHFAGPMYTQVEAETPNSFEIRFRDGVFSLSAEEYVVWAMAHGDPEFVGTIPTTRAVVEYAARAAGVALPEPVLDGLVDDGLLVQVPFAGGLARDFARQYQLIPLALGLGNTSQNPAEFQIGLPNAPRVSVGYDVYHLWIFSHRSPTLWDAVQQVADEARESNEEDRADEERVTLVDDPNILLTALMRALPILISTSCVFLERPG